MTQDILLFIAIGFGAQIIDGALGMAFGVITTSSLLAFGVPPVTASALTHVTEIFTTAASGTSHAAQRNVDWRLVARLAPAGMIGGAIGAFTLANIDAGAIEPFVAIYLMGIGAYILFKAFRPLWPRDVRDRLIPVIGFGGGVLDAMGGGGWGPIVTTSLVGRGHEPKKVIGSTSLTEFLV
ncbi:MAG TPA: sulfite exporter TauE/SafE family protein, partial [Pseudorhizobium sp.]|nr:sulfite exporter TauE/SafE family protein [Pseudorhizobium sp.]